MATSSVKSYFVIWASLIGLLALTWLIARFDLGAFNVVAALTIAITKMVLVILFFMNVRNSSRLTWIFAAAGFIWLAIMFDLTLSDYLTRGSVKGSQRIDVQARPSRELDGARPASRPKN